MNEEGTPMLPEHSLALYAGPVFMALLAAVFIYPHWMSGEIWPLLAGIVVFAGAFAALCGFVIATSGDWRGIPLFLAGALVAWVVYPWA